MAVQNKVLYAFRGWIAFVAFMDLGTAGRSYIEKRSFLNHPGETDQMVGDFTITRTVGMYFVLKALALIHCTLYIHYKPVVSMGYWSLVLTILLYITEVFYFQSTNLNFYVVFPCVLNVLTLLGLIYLPTKLKLWGKVPGTSGMQSEIEDENTQILRHMGTLRRRKYQKNKNI